jgi:hypothetical protein
VTSVLATLTKRLSIAALAAVAIAATAVTAPAEAAPTTAGCPAKSSPTLTLGNTGEPRVELPAAPGWTVEDPKVGGTKLTVGHARSVEGDDLYYNLGVVKDPARLDTAEKLAAAETSRNQVTARRSLAGPCGLPTASVTYRFAEPKTGRPVFQTDRYTLVSHGNYTYGIVVGVNTYDEARLPQLERDVLDGYGITL